MVEFLKNFKKYFSYIIYSTKSRLKSEVSKSYLNALWWILNPLCHMLIYIFVVQVVFKASEPYFPIYVLIGITLWNYFSRSINGSIKLINSNRSVLNKAYIPKYILLLINHFTLLFKMLISLFIIFILMIFFKVPITSNFIMIIPIILILFIVSFGIGLILAHLGVFIGDLNNIMDLLLKVIYYLSGIFYSIETRVPTPFNGILLNFNPIAFLINESRNSLLFNNKCNYIILLVWLIIGLILCNIGLKLFKKYENIYAKVM